MYIASRLHLGKLKKTGYILIIAKAFGLTACGGGGGGETALPKSLADRPQPKSQPQPTPPPAPPVP